MDIPVALAQIKPKLGCVADNLLLIEEAVERAVQTGLATALSVTSARIRVAQPRQSAWRRGASPS